LSKDDKTKGVPVLLAKITRFRPLVVCFVGKGIWDIFFREVKKLADNSRIIPQEPITPMEPRISTSSGASTPMASQDVKVEMSAVAVNPSAKATNARRKVKNSKNPRAKKAGRSITWGIQPCKVVHTTNFSQGGFATSHAMNIE